ncbi:MAG: flagellar brake protein [Rhodocyclaceae bacterium]|nr:flagellar brake protein [Rhodocyclaceae bacterium]
MTVQSITAEELDKFSTNHRREILFYLHHLISDGERVSVVFNEGSEMFLTVLLDIDEEHGLLIFDWGGSEETNQKLLKSERNFFVCAPHGVKNQFMTGAVREISYQQRRAFATRLPERFTRLQRREFFRLTLPFTRRPLCTLPLENGEPRQLSVIDISIGGLAMELPPGESSSFEVGQKLAQAHIELKVGGMLEVDLEVRNVCELQRGNKLFGRVGCQFIAPSHAVEHQLQRFISDVQREERARLGA